MDVREKLVELLDAVQRSGYTYTPSQMDDRYGYRKDIPNTKVADHLIAHGVTVQEWISVKDRLPEHGDVVTAWHTYMEHPFVCQWDERSDCWIDDKWTFGRNTITHWCRLPQPPKGE